jgi:hypothetical protein
LHNNLTTPFYIQGRKERFHAKSERASANSPLYILPIGCRDDEVCIGQPSVKEVIGY